MFSNRPKDREGQRVAVRVARSRCNDVKFYKRFNYTQTRRAGRQTNYQEATIATHAPAERFAC